MSYTTYAAFVSGLAGLTISGVTRKYTEPPGTVGDADMPISYPRITSQSNETLTIGQVGGLDRGTADLVVVVERYEVNSNAANFAATMAMVDAINTAMKAAIDTLGIDRWEIRPEDVTIGTSQCWALVVTVEASG